MVTGPKPTKKKCVLSAPKKWIIRMTSPNIHYPSWISMVVGCKTFLFFASEAPHMNWSQHLLNFNIRVALTRLFLSFQRLVTKDVIGIGCSNSLVIPTCAALNKLMYHHPIQRFVAPIAEFHHLWFLYFRVPYQFHHHYIFGLRTSSLRYVHPAPH